MTGNSGSGDVRAGRRRAWAWESLFRHAPEWLCTRFLGVVFLANEEELTGNTFTTSLNTTNPNTYVKFIFLRTSPLISMAIKTEWLQYGPLTKLGRISKKNEFLFSWVGLCGRVGGFFGTPEPRAYMAVESTVSIGYWRLTTGLETWDPMGNAGGGGGGMGHELCKSTWENSNGKNNVNQDVCQSLFRQKQPTKSAKR